VLDAKLKSPQWQTEMERAEALAARVDQSTATARSVVQRLTTLLTSFEASRGELQAWELRVKHAEQSAERLSKLINQAQSMGSRFEKAVDSRHRLIAALAQNTSNLADVIHRARVEDETLQPTPMSGVKRAEPLKSNMAGKSAGRFDWSALHTPVGAK